MLFPRSHDHSQPPYRLALGVFSFPSYTCRYPTLSSSQCTWHCRLKSTINIALKEGKDLPMLRNMSRIACMVSLIFAGPFPRQAANGYVIHSPENVIPKLSIPAIEPSPKEKPARERNVAAEEAERQNDDFRFYYLRPTHHPAHHQDIDFVASPTKSLVTPLAVVTPCQDANSLRPPQATGVTTETATAVLSPLESWCISKLDRWYGQSQSAKCPFLRRRSGDVLDAMETVMKHAVIRRECWPLMGPPQAHRPAGTKKKLNRIKYRGLSLERLRDYVLDDWRADTGKGYYVTGKLTTAIYRDDCWFLGPDPDMPIHGLRKYVGVAAHLFDYDASFASLDSLEIVPENRDYASGKLVATWTLGGILRLPWKPRLPTFSGRTVYHIDDDGLIERHEESWDCSVMRAFCHTLFPELADRIWSVENGGDDGD